MGGMGSTHKSSWEGGGQLIFLLWPKTSMRLLYSYHPEKTKVNTIPAISRVFSEYSIFSDGMHVQRESY